MVMHLQDNGKDKGNGAWDVEYVASDEEGLVIFDGGTYSRGPAALLEPGEVATSGSDESLEADRERLQRQLSLEVSLPSSPEISRSQDLVRLIP